MTRARTFPLLATSAVVLALLPVGAEERPPNPHGGGSCEACHSPESPPGLENLIEGAPDALCDSCHPGDDLHEVGIPQTETRAQEGMLLVNDLVSCVSCHDEPACEGRPVAPEDPFFYRGGPVSDVSELCFRCHLEEDMVQFNPHEESFLPDGTINPDTCDYCHVDVPDPASARSIEDIELRVGSINTCRGCHLTTPHAGTHEHQVEAPAEMVARMEDTRTRTGVTIVLDPHGRVFCVSCHNPHPPGVLRSPPAYAGYGTTSGQPLIPSDFYERVTVRETQRRNETLMGAGAEGPPLAADNEEPDFLRLPLSGGELCSACHDPAAIPNGADPASP